MSKRQRSFVAVISALITAGWFAAPVDAASSKRVTTNCCELRAPSSLRFVRQGDGATAVNGDLNVAVFTLTTDSAVEATYQAVEAMGGGSVTYQTESSQWAVKSGYLDGTDIIYYLRAEYDRGCGEAGVIQITFPKSKKKQYEAATATMSKSFRADLCGN
jgi:hypothetical protein